MYTVLGSKKPCVAQKPSNFGYIVFYRQVNKYFENYLPTYKRFGSTFDKLTIPNHAYEYLYGMYVFEKVSCTTELHPTIILDQR